MITQLLLLLSWLDSVHGLAGTTNSKNKPPRQHQQPLSQKSINPNTYSFSVPLSNKRPKPESFIGTLRELWNDPRPVSSLIASNDRSNVGERENDVGAIEEIPYCIVSDEFEVEGGELFQILLYPRGTYVRDDDASSSSNGYIPGPASAYLRYLPRKYGDEIDIAWKLRLCSAADGEGKKTLSVATSGGLPRSNTTWSAAITFCSELESVESVGRAADWGSSSWSADEVCGALGDLVAEGEIVVFDRRGGESSFSWPPLRSGAAGAVNEAKNGASDRGARREYRAGEVIVPRNIPGLEAEVESLKERFVYPGIDYRIMTMSDGDGNPIFSTRCLDGGDEKGRARLALRPIGWKSQQRLWREKGMTTDWPVEVDAGLLSRVATSRFDPESAVPRVVSAFQRDSIAYGLALALALAPIPLALVARNFVSLYDIPSASMEPTLLKGDLLLVEKFPGVYRRTGRGDVVLFKPPSALRDIVTASGSRLSSTSLFVKRIAGLPGDRDIRLVDDGDVLVDGRVAAGPDRDLCADEPLRLIDRLLEDGKGRDVDRLGDDEVFVLGDCKAVSVDSRVFGILPKENIVGRPVARVWPLNRIKLSGPF